MTTETNKAAVRRFHECFDAGDWSGVAALCTKDMKSYQTGVDGAQSYAAFEAFANGFGRAFSQSRMIIEDQVAEGDVVATRITWSGIHTGDFNGIPASGRPVRIECCVFDRFKDGKITEHRGQFDAMALMAQIGAIPVPA